MRAKTRLTTAFGGIVPPMFCFYFYLADLVLYCVVVFLYASPRYLPLGRCHMYQPWSFQSSHFCLPLAIVVAVILHLFVECNYEPRPTSTIFPKRPPSHPPFSNPPQIQT